MLLISIKNNNKLIITRNKKLFYVDSFFSNNRNFYGHTIVTKNNLNFKITRANASIIYVST